MKDVELVPYPYHLEIPDIVNRAHERAREIGFPLMPAGRPVGQPAPATAITPMDGALIRWLAAGYPSGLIGEIGTGAGVSTAWLVSGMGPGARLISCEIDRELAEGAAAFFVNQPAIEIRCGTWEHVLSPVEPFDLLFFDADAQAVLADKRGCDRILDLVKIGGTIVMDDLFPIEMWPEEWKGTTDHKREFCLCNARIAGLEVRTSGTTVSVIGTKLS